MGKIIDFKKVKKNKKEFLMKIIFFATVIYVIFAIYLIFKTPTETITVEQGVLTEEEMATGYIIRSENVIKGKNYKNGISQILSEGEKAAKDQTVFRYYGKSEEELQANIDEINLKIQQALEKEKDSIFSADAKTLENQIETKVQNIQNLKDVQTISEYKKEISNIVEKKAKIFGENSQSGSYIKKLMNEKEQYEKKLTDGSEYIKAPVSGIVSYRVDGFEEVLGTENFDNLTSEILEKLDIKTGKIVSTNNECAKIIDDFNCYIAVVLNSDTAKKAEIGEFVNITLASGNEIKTSIIYKKIQDDGKALIVFKLPVLTNELMSYRKISFNITWWSYSGLKVPNSAILEDEQGLKYVIRKKAGLEQKIIVKVLKKNDKYSVVGTYNNSELEALGIDAKGYIKISQYDNILLYPEAK